MAKPALTVVPREHAAIESMRKALAEIMDGVELGEFTSLLILGFKPDGVFVTKECGSPRGKLEKIACLEILKSDLIAAMETPDE
jgi:hypothetical protein